jgi:hypothetical protein
MRPLAKDKAKDNHRNRGILPDIGAWKQIGKEALSGYNLSIFGVYKGQWGLYLDAGSKGRS